MSGGTLDSAVVLAQVRGARMRAPLNDPIMARFAFGFDAVTRSSSRL